MHTKAVPTVYLIDASIYIFRAWFSVPDSMRGEDGTPVNAVYGFCRFLTEFVERTQASHVAVAFDESLTQSFRNELYPAYKMNRELPPEDLARQFQLCRRVAEAAGLFCVAHERYEADDLIATLSLIARDQGYRNAIVSGDKDLTQLLRGGDFWWDFARNQQLDAARVKDKFGVPPETIQDYLGLCGDAVDNIPGVPGVGPKTASALLQAFGDMDQVYRNLDAISTLKIRGAKTLAGKLSQHEAQARLSRELATVAYDAPVDAELDNFRRRAAEQNSLQEISHVIGGRGAGLFERLSVAARAQ
ncbi:MAG: exodeoxyribonuclease IX [Gammaproteobacteria bacterium]|nr:exodeoxyribonuclease IX [Gammaproteobacteria bacterium]